MLPDDCKCTQYVVCKPCIRKGLAMTNERLRDADKIVCGCGCGVTLELVHGIVTRILLMAEEDILGS